jgi:hypothetical protein
MADTGEVVAGGSGGEEGRGAPSEEPRAFGLEDSGLALSEEGIQEGGGLERCIIASAVEVVVVAVGGGLVEESGWFGEGGASAGMVGLAMA